MPDIDSAATGAFGPLQGEATASVSAIDVQVLAPMLLARVGTSELTLLVSNTSGANSDIQVEVSTNTAFSSTAFSTTLTNRADGSHSAMATGLSIGTTYYWRARAADTGTTGWGPWSGVPTVTYTTLTPVASTASSFSGAGFEAGKAFDANASTFWLLGAGAVMPQWLAAELSVATVVHEARLYLRQVSINVRYPADFTIQGSPDGSAWTTLATWHYDSWPTALAYVHLAWENTTAYKHYRLHMTTSGGDNQIGVIALDLLTSVVGASVPASFILNPAAARAIAYVTENVGGSGALVAHAYETVTENVGLEPTVSPRAVEYTTVNVGLETVLRSRVTEYIYYGDVSTNDPVPHLWFLWRPYGFAGNEIWAFGHGFGNPQSEYSGLMRVDPGPDYTTADITAGVNEWYEQAAQPHAYDEQRVIHPGSDSVEPLSEPEVGIIRFLIPAGIGPEEGESFIHRMYVRTSEGDSNAVDWINYPTIPVANATVLRGVSTVTVMRLAAEREAEGIEQRYFYTDVPTYVITGGRAERPPALSASVSALGVLGTGSTEDGVSPALSVDLGAKHRWVADESKLTPRPDLGTGVVVWDPSAGLTTAGWKLRSDSSPYVDEQYTIPSRLGDLEVPAMVFPGDAFAELTDAITAGPTFTIAIVAVLHAPPGGRGTVFSSFQSVPDPDLSDYEIYHQSDRMKLAIGGVFADRNLNTDSGRPVIIIGTVYGTTSRLLVVDERPSSHVSRRPTMATAGNQAYLARSWRIDDDAIDYASMDVLDVAWWDVGKTDAGMWVIANKLDGIYGVTG